MAKRLPCVVLIPPGEIEHHGEHSHDIDAKCFHHCETRYARQSACECDTEDILWAGVLTADTSARSL